MRQFGLLAATILIIVPLSGCLEGIFITGDEEAAVAVLSDGWVQLGTPAARDHIRAYGLFVPAGANELRIEWPSVNATDSGPSPDAQDWETDGFAYGSQTAVLSVFAPTGERVYVGNPTMRLVFSSVPAGASAPAPSLETVTQVFVQQSPAPGLYRLATSGAMDWPSIALRVPPDTDVLPLFPLPLSYARHVVADSLYSGDAVTGADGSWTPTQATLNFEPYFMGAAGPATFIARNSQGAEIVHARTFVTPTPGSQESALGFAPGTITFDHRADLSLFDDGPWPYTLATAGPTVTLAWATSAIARAVPTSGFVGPTNGTGAGSDGDDIVALAGRLNSWSAAWYDHPAGGQLLVSFDTEAADNRFRVYDTAGTRVAWADDATADNPLLLPAGRLIIVNDGRSPLQAAIVGATPADASLHDVPMEVSFEELDATQSVGWFDKTHTIHAPGPIIAIELQETLGYATDLALSVENADGVLANLPRIGPAGPRVQECCGFPFLSTLPSDGHWLDGGTYRVRLQGSAAAGLLHFGFGWLDPALVAAAGSDDGRLG